MIDESCPWNTHPKTIEGMIESCEAQGIWEEIKNELAPIQWCIVPTRRWALELCLRLKSLEDNK